MADGKFSDNLKCLFLIPSFYGAVTWGAWLCLYLLKLIRVDDCGMIAMGVFLLMETMFILSLVVSLPFYLQSAEAEEPGGAVSASAVGGWRFGTSSGLLLLHTIGFLGLALYVLDFSRNLGGIAGFFLALVSESHAIRWEAETSTSIGTQLSYIGWIAIALTVYHVAAKRIPRYWLAVAVLQFLGNLLFIDRTRPLWILFSSLLMILPAVGRLELRKILRWAAGSVVVALLIFWLVAEWTGKTAYEGKYDDSRLPGIAREMYAYGVGGFAYFGKMLASNEQLSYRPVRVSYPAGKLLARFGLAQQPPGQVLDYYDVPFSTNVGTFLEPFYRDGGLLFVLCGIMLYSFGFDLLGRQLLRSGRPLAIYAWSSLCFTVFIGFFTPKIGSFPLWLFVAAGCLSLLAGQSARVAHAAGTAADRVSDP